MTEREELAQLLNGVDLLHEWDGLGVPAREYYFRRADAILASQWLKDRDGEHYDAGREDHAQEVRQSASDFVSGAWR